MLSARFLLSSLNSWTATEFEAQLMKGATAWNAWVKEHRNIVPNLKAEGAVPCRSALSLTAAEKATGHLINVPIANDHLDRRYHCLIGVASIGVASLLKSQAFNLKLDCCIGIVKHGPSPKMQVANFCLKHGGGWAFPWRNLGSLFARSKQKAPAFD
jgi:hypothetical protein